MCYVGVYSWYRTCAHTHKWTSFERYAFAARRTSYSCSGDAFYVWAEHCCNQGSLPMPSQRRKTKKKIGHCTDRTIHQPSSTRNSRTGARSTSFRLLPGAVGPRLAVMQGFPILTRISDLVRTTSVGLASQVQKGLSCLWVLLKPGWPMTTPSADRKVFTTDLSLNAGFRYSFKPERKTPAPSCELDLIPLLVVGVCCLSPCRGTSELDPSQECHRRHQNHDQVPSRRHFMSIDNHAHRR